MFYITLLVVRLQSFIRELAKRLCGRKPSTRERRDAARQVSSCGLRLSTGRVNAIRTGHQVHPHGFHKDGKGLSTDIGNTRASNSMRSGLQHRTRSINSSNKDKKYLKVSSRVHLSRLADLKGYIGSRNINLDQLTVSASHKQTCIDKLKTVLQQKGRTSHGISVFNLITV